MSSDETGNADQLSIAEKEQPVMSITPQLIKDQEFQIKFRGFDPIEVQDYLETIAEEFFELQEQCKEQLEELEALRKEKENFESYNSSLETDMQFTRKISDELKEGCSQKEEKIQELNNEIEELQLRIADIEEEKAEQEEEVSAAEARIKEAEEAVKAAQVEQESLRSKIGLLQEQNSELKKDEVEFRTTLSTAQRFAEDLKKKSRIQAEKMIADAHAEINRIRQDAQEELDRLPREIDALKRKRGEVKDELKGILETYLETLDVFYPVDEPEQEPQEEESPEQEAVVADEVEEDELFQKVEIREDGSLNQEDLAKIDMALDAPSDGGVQEEETLASLLDGEQEDDEIFNLKDMFRLDLKEEGKGQESS